MPRGVYQRTSATREAISVAAKRAWQRDDRKPRDATWRLKITGRPCGVTGGYTMSASALAHRRRVSARGVAGLRASEEGRARIAVAAAKRLALRQQSYMWTKPERRMAALLDAAHVAYESQKRFGRYVVDFFLPALNAVIEVDGVYWHPAGPDPRRDAYLVARGVAHVMHVTDVQLA